MKTRLLPFLLVFSLGPIGCGLDDACEPPPPPGNHPGTYSCACLDSSGTNVRTEVLLSLFFNAAPPDTFIEGTWHLPDPEHADRTMLPFSMQDSGSVAGAVEGDTLWVTLTPGWADAGFLMRGAFSAEPFGDFTGTWREIGFAGILQTGSLRGVLLTLPVR